jgi:F420-0:gamma-glutamyl ligase-like protein
MTRYNALPLATRFWRPGADYLSAIVHAIEKSVRDGDFVVVSEKALSTALGNMLDEDKFVPSSTARVLAKYWMRWGWGYGVGVICGFGQRLLRRLREYPVESGSRHKQVALQQSGLMQAFMFGSEAGIDGSNLPYSLVSLPLPDSDPVAEQIRRYIRQCLGKKVAVVIVDTDKTYTFHNFHFTPRPNPLRGINSRGNIVAYVLGRLFRLRRRSTPLAVAGCEMSAETALTIANVADRARGPGSGATVWDMAARFKVAATGVSWEMLEKITHKPIVIVRKVVET